MGYPYLSSRQMHAAQANQGEKKLLWVAHLVTKLSCASECALHLGRGKTSGGDERCAEAYLEGHFSLNALRAVREPLEQIQSRTKTIDRIRMGRALQRLLARPPQVLDRLGEVIAATVVMRQLVQMVPQLLGEHRL